MNKFLLPFCLVFAAAPVLAQAPTPLDGAWRGRSDGGSCNAPLDYVLTIENGFVDGSSYDTTARGRRAIDCGWKPSAAISARRRSALPWSRKRPSEIVFC